MRFLFWNIKKNSVWPLLSEIAKDPEIEVVVLAECADQAAALRALDEAPGPSFYLTDSKGTRVDVFTRFPPEYAVSRYHDSIVTIRHLLLPERGKILMAAAHLPSKLHYQRVDQQFVSFRVSEEIQRVENEVGHSRTVLLGDLNMDPFEEGMISAAGLHSVMTRRIARDRFRKVREKYYPFFYNPMWGRFGDMTVGPPGTYYWNGRLPSEYFWHMFDQVLVRPDLIDLFRPESLRILEDCGSKSFLSESGIPDAFRVSDHLPLMFDLDL